MNRFCEAGAAMLWLMIVNGHTGNSACQIAERRRIPVQSDDKADLRDRSHSTRFCRVNGDSDHHSDRTVEKAGL